MNYEKKYKEALELARIYRDNANAVEEYSAVARYENIFPELRESEDERVIKALEAFINQPEIADKITFEARIEWLSWLEKQKEQKHPNGCFTCDEYKKGYEEGRRNGFTVGYNKAMKEVEQKEQKPAEWSEEDEEMIKMILGDLEWERRNTTVDKDIRHYDEEIAWLKSLRPSWKPSEEHLSALLAIFNDPNNIGSQTCQLALTDLYEQLKKL